MTSTAAVAASLKDYAALRALGFSMGALRSIVLGQTLWIGVAGVGVAALLTVGLIGLAGSQAVPIVLSPAMMATAAVLVILVALLSGVFALRRVAQADPASLLL